MYRLGILEIILGTMILALVVTAGCLSGDDSDNTDPVADAGPDQAVDEDSLVTFDGSGSSDDDAVDNWTWTFNDGLADITLFGPTPNWTFMEPGVYNLTLTVSDAAGNTDLDWVVITVTGPTYTITEFEALMDDEDALFEETEDGFILHLPAGLEVGNTVTINGVVIHSGFSTEGGAGGETEMTLVDPVYYDPDLEWDDYHWTNYGDFTLDGDQSALVSPGNEIQMIMSVVSIDCDINEDGETFHVEGAFPVFQTGTDLCEDDEGVWQPTADNIKVIADSAAKGAKAAEAGDCHDFSDGTGDDPCESFALAPTGTIETSLSGDGNATIYFMRFSPETAPTEIKVTVTSPTGVVIICDFVNDNDGDLVCDGDISLTYADSAANLLVNTGDRLQLSAEGGLESGQWEIEIIHVDTGELITTAHIFL